MPPQRAGGIRKRQQQRRDRDRDGDLVMGAAPRASTASKSQTSGSNRNLVELKVTGWTDETEIPKITKFLERHASKRNAGAKSGGLSSNLIRRSRVSADVLTINVRPDDVPAFSKINGFSFPSAHGQQKLTIIGNGVKPKADTDSSSDSKSATNEIRELLTGFLERRYDPAQKLLNLSSIAEDAQVAATGMFETAARQSKFMPVLMTMIENQLKSKEARREAIHSVTLSNNNLPTLNIVRDVALTLPHIKNLDLSGNKLSNTKDMMAFKNKLSNLEYLIISNNPLETAQKDWQKVIMGWYPRLRILNGETVRTDAQIARLDAPKQTAAPSSTPIWLDNDNIAHTFLVDFVQGFDSDREGVLRKYYDASSTFTMAVNARAQGGAGKSHEKTPWDSYLPQSRNIKIIHSKNARANRKSRGLEAIHKAFSTIPPTRHGDLATNKFIIDCTPQQGIPDPTGQFNGVSGLTIQLRGEYEEHRTAKGANEIVRRAFERTFTLGPGGPSGVRVVNDMLSLRAAGGVPAWIPLVMEVTAAPVPAQGAVEAPGTVAQPVAQTGLTAEQEAMVLHVHQATKLNLQLATECLQAANWNLETAAQIFNAQKDNLPPEAFVATV